MRLQCEPTLFHFFLDAMRHVFDWLSFLTRKCFGSCSASRLFHSSKPCCHQTNWAWCETSNCSTGSDRQEKTAIGTVTCALVKASVESQILARKKKINESQLLQLGDEVAAVSHSYTEPNVNLGHIWKIIFFLQGQCKEKKDKNCNSPPVQGYIGQNVPAFTLRMTY